MVTINTLKTYLLSILTLFILTISLIIISIALATMGEKKNHWLIWFLLSLVIYLALSFLLIIITFYSDLFM